MSTRKQMLRKRSLSPSGEEYQKTRSKKKGRGKRKVVIIEESTTEASSSSNGDSDDDFQPPLPMPRGYTHKTSSTIKTDERVRITRSNSRMEQAKSGQKSKDVSAKPTVSVPKSASPEKAQEKKR